MNLHRMLLERKAAGKPVRVGLIGAGKFGTMFLSQARLTDGLHVAGIADLNIPRALSQLKLACWPETQFAAKTLADAIKTGGTCVTENADVLINNPDIEVIIEATGDPRNGIKYALKAIEAGKHIVMVKR